MNLKAPLVIGCLTAVLVAPSTTSFAGGRQGASFARSGGGRSAPQRAAFRGSAGGFRGSAAQFRGSAGTFRRNSMGAVRRSNNNWAGTNRFAGVSRTNNWSSRNTFATNRLSTGTTATNWNRFNNRTTRFSNNWTGANRFRGTGFHGGHSANWWRRHHDCGSNVFFSFGFPFFGAWDYGYYYPSAYYPYYPYTSYSYDPYTYYPGYSGYNGYIDPGYGNQYYDDGQNYNPGSGHDGQQYDSHQYNRGTHDSSVVSRVQEQLAHDGYYKGAVDGVAGSRTYYAIRAYQRDHNLPVTGEITDDLLGEMGLR